MTSRTPSMNAKAILFPWGPPVRVASACGSRSVRGTSPASASVCTAKSGAGDLPGVRVREAVGETRRCGTPARNFVRLPVPPVAEVDHMAGEGEEDRETEAGPPLAERLGPDVVQQWHPGIIRPHHKRGAVPT